MVFKIFTKKDNKDLEQEKDLIENSNDNEEFEGINIAINNEVASDEEIAKIYCKYENEPVSLFSENLFKDTNAEDTTKENERVVELYDKAENRAKEVEIVEKIEAIELVEEALESDLVNSVDKVESVETEEVEETLEEVKVIEIKDAETTEEVSEEVAGDKVLSTTDDENMTSNKEILEKLDLLNEYFKQKLLYDKHKDTIIDKLHKEVQDYKDDMHLKIIKPLLISIIQVKDSIEKSERIYREKSVEELDAVKLLDILGSFAEELGDILDMYNVVQYKEEGKNFKAIRQKIIKIEKTESDELDKSIKQSLSYGYELDGKVISPEKIVVYKKA